MQLKNAPILLTSLPRSGSTWVMKILSASNEVVSFHEPDHLHVWGIGEPGMHPYHPVDNDDNDYMSMYGRIFMGAPYREPTVSRGYLSHKWKCMKYKFSKKRLLVKSVYSIHNTEWIANRFPVKVVMLLRHPCAITHSIHRRWSSARLKNPELQPDFARDYLQPYLEPLKNAQSPYEVLSSRIGAYYKAASSVVARHPEWTVVKHEDLCGNPQEEFTRLFKTLGLGNIDGALDLIRETNRPKTSDEVQHVHRLMSHEIDKWQSILSPDEIDSIAKYYCPFDTDWYSEFCESNISTSVISENVEI